MTERMADDCATMFSTLSPSILDREDRLRVGRQILAVLEHHLGAGGLVGRRVLDIGCSSGIITGLIASAAGPTVGIDVDEPALYAPVPRCTRRTLDSAR